MELFGKIKKSFSFALAGVLFFLQERNIKIHLTVTLLIIVFGFLFNITASEWIFLVFSIVLVISFEIINTVIEEFIDFTHSEKNDKVMIIKDLAAAAVLVAALGSIIVGLIVFVPYIILALQ